MHCISFDVRNKMVDILSEFVIQKQKRGCNCVRVWFE